LTQPEEQQLPSKSSILFLDDHVGVRDGVSFILSKNNPDLEFYNASNFNEAISLFNENKNISCAIIDINIDGSNGLDFIPEFRKIIPSLNVIVYTMYSDILHIESALKKNIQGYITKSTTIEELSRAIDFVSQGSTYYCREVKPILSSLLNSSPIYTNSEDSTTSLLFENYKLLTPKEQEVFHLLAQEYSNEEIAKLTGKTLKTVLNQKTQIYQKLQVNDRLSLIRAAKKIGVIL